MTSSVIARETEKMLRASGLTPQCTKQVLDTDSVGRTLVACHIGSYKASSVCVACPVGLTSLAGATSASDCHFCAAGSYLHETFWLCVECPAGFMKDVIEDAACTPCPEEQTSSAGATECHFCAAGSYLDATSLLCVECPAGFMKDVVEDAACTPCPGGNTSLAGATSASECYCPADSYLNATSSLCVECPGGAALHSGSNFSRGVLLPCGGVHQLRLERAFGGAASAQRLHERGVGWEHSS